MSRTLDLVDLRAAQRSLAPPFDVALSEVAPSSLAEGPFTVTCEEIFRLLPARRLVARVIWREQRYVLKLFFDGKAQRDCSREVAGLAALAGSAVPTPRICAQVTLASDACGLLLEYLPGAKEIDWSDTPGVTAVACLLADMHAQGVWQDDLHLDNFLTSGERVFAIDGGGVRSRHSALNEKSSFANLGVLLAKRPPLVDDEIAAIGRAYCERRNWQIDDRRAQRQLAAVAIQRRARVRRYLAKVQRDCTEFAVAKTFTRYQVCVRERGSFSLTGLIDAPAKAVESGAVLKAGNSATVARVAMAVGASVVVKRYNVKSLAHALRRALKPQARFRRAWINGQRLHFLNIPTPRPLALIEQRIGPWRGVAYLVTEDLGDVDLLTEITASGLSEKRCTQITAIFTSLQRAGLTHGDTKASNFLIWQDEVFLIDLDAMTENPAGLRKDLARFLQNWDGAIRRRFAEAFQEAGLV